MRVADLPLLDTHADIARPEVTPPPSCIAGQILRNAAALLDITGTLD